MPAAISEITQIKRTLYTRLASLYWEGTLLEEIDDLPDEILSNTNVAYRCCQHKERAILRERIRVAIGLRPDQVKKHQLLRDMAQTAISQFGYKQPVSIEMMAVACDRCPIDRYVVTNACRNCVAHRCVHSCPKDAITIVNQRAYIDRGRCIECGRCAKSCQYHAIIEVTRPCEHACAVKAIGSDADGVANIDRTRCVDCGACIVSCPFGSISDYTQVLPVTAMLKQTSRPVYALLAPSFVGQFGPKVSPGMLRSALLELGFTEVIEVARAAEEVATAEAQEYAERQEQGSPAMTTSCCPSFVELIDKHYPELKEIMSHTVSPMARLANQVKASHPDAYVVFIGPCTSKKVEAAKVVTVDAVLTFEELQCVLAARGLDPAMAVAQEVPSDAGPLGRGFAASGGVARAVLESLPSDCAVPEVRKCSGLGEAVQVLAELKQQSAKAMFVEGMACQGGCIGGPGALINPVAAERLLQRYCQQK